MDFQLFFCLSSSPFVNSAQPYIFYVSFQKDQCTICWNDYSDKLQDQSVEDFSSTTRYCVKLSRYYIKKSEGFTTLLTSALYLEDIKKTIKLL